MDRGTRDGIVEGLFIGLVAWWIVCAIWFILKWSAIALVAILGWIWTGLAASTSWGIDQWNSRRSRSSEHVPPAV